MQRELTGIKERSGQREGIKLSIVAIFLSDDNEIVLIGLEKPSFRY